MTTITQSLLGTRAVAASVTVSRDLLKIIVCSCRYLSPYLSVLLCLSLCLSLYLSVSLSLRVCLSASLPLPASPCWRPPRHVPAFGCSTSPLTPRVLFAVGDSQSPDVGGEAHGAACMAETRGNTWDACFAVPVEQAILGFDAGHTWV